MPKTSQMCALRSPGLHLTLSDSAWELLPAWAAASGNLAGKTDVNSPSFYESMSDGVCMEYLEQLNLRKMEKFGGCRRQ